MKRLKIRAAMAGAAAITIVGLVANPAAAFYTSGGCSIGSSNMLLTNYSKGSGQEYHWSVNKVAYWPSVRVYAAGVQIFKGGAPAEGFKYYASPTASYTFKAVWYSADGDGGTRTCSKTF